MLSTRQSDVLIRPCVLVAALVVILALVVPFSDARRHTHVLCDRISPTIIRECPIAYPVCCIWPNRVFTACCPANSRCDLYGGECVLMSNSTDATTSAPASYGWGENPPAATPSSDDDNAMIVDGTPGASSNSQAGVEVSLQFASSFVGVLFFGFLMTVSAAISYGKRSAIRREEARRQRELEQRELLQAADASSSSESESDNGENTEDEHLLCKVCFAKKCDCVLVRCGHITCCRHCAKKLSQCPICRKHVEHIIKIDNALVIEHVASQQLKISGGDDAPVANGVGIDMATLSTADNSLLSPDHCPSTNKISHREDEGAPLLLANDCDLDEDDAEMSTNPQGCSKVGICIMDEGANERSPTHSVPNAAERNDSRV